ncbi:helix-turn-helix domain-containing protein [Psychroserpens algicola]|uniref:Helix-turn-helix domain-containing protein n=1 Tax=Psychroserpens algicola TaxID=1719034 RepID=A0ABT0H9T5_9FLAO|nr:AraC family transcriptional regulator [Psychroserpens algicola]MCK8480595.1 helix-turn-helix domain-containing protein [Psychroserpens algicola]
MKLNYLFIVLLILPFSSINGLENTITDELIQHYKSENCHKILPLLEEVISENSENPLFWFNKGLCETQVKDYSAAKQSFLIANQLDVVETGKVTSERLYYNLALSELKLNNTDESLSYIEKTLQPKKVPSPVFQDGNFSELKDNTRYVELMDMYKPSLNKWTSVFLFIVFQGVLLFSILIFRKKGNKKSNIILGLFVLSFALTLAIFVLYWSGYIYVYPFRYFVGLFVVLSYLFGPLLLMYIQSLFTEKLRFKTIFHHFIPYSACFLLYVTRLFFDVSETIFEPLINVLFSPWVRIAHMSIYLVLIYLYVKKEKYNVANNVSAWLHYLTYSFFGLILSYIIYFSLVNFSFFNLEWDYMISFMISFFIILISIMGYMQPEVFWGFRIEEVLTFVKYKKSGLSKSLSIELKQKLLSLMVDEKVYKENTISLERLSQKLGTSKHNTSQVINEHFKENFFEFLNDFRIEEAKELLVNDHNHLNITEILYEVGFNNKVSFNNAFKKRTGLTPTQYKTQMLSMA